MPTGNTGSYLMDASSTTGCDRTRSRSDTVTASEPGAKSPAGASDAAGLSAGVDGPVEGAADADGAADGTAADGLVDGTTLDSQAATTSRATIAVTRRDLWVRIVWATFGARGRGSGSSRPVGQARSRVGAGTCDARGARFATPDVG